MLDFITGLLVGRNYNRIITNKKPVEINTADNKPIVEIINIPKVTKYVSIPDIYDFDATLGSSYEDYEDTNLVLIYKNGHINYYLEVLVPEVQEKWGDQDLLDFI